MRVSVFGIGYVGVVSSCCFAALGHEVIGVDVSDEKVDLLNAGHSPIVEPETTEMIGAAVRSGNLRATKNVKEAVFSTDVSMISVGTPSGPTGALSLDAVDKVAEQIGAAMAEKERDHLVVMRSTVPPGTAETRVIPTIEKAAGRRHGDGWTYYSNPEFLRESTAVMDFRMPPFTLIGAPHGDPADGPRSLYASVNAPMHVVPYRIAESVKFLSNAYHAVKLAFANEAGAILSEYDVDAREAFRLFCEDRTLNISPAYLRPGFAFGGSCLPKDIRSFLALARSKNVAAPMLSQVLPSNESIVSRAFEAITRNGRQPIALLGLAFKDGSDDLRESPLVTLAERLIGKGWDIRIYDRSINVAFLRGTNRAYIEREIPHFERLLIRDPREAIAKSRIVVLGHVGPQDKELVIEAITDHVVVDLCGVKELEMKQRAAYTGICW